MEEQDLAIVDTLKEFLKRFNCAFHYIKNPKEALDEFFELIDDGDGIIYVHLKTPIGVFSHGYMLDLNMDDIESIINRLKKYTENVLRFQYHIDV